MTVVEKLEDIQKISVNSKVLFKLNLIGLEPEKLFLVIRNMALNPSYVLLDFDGVDEVQWLTAYVTTDIQVEISQLVERLAKILCDSVDGTIDRKFQTFSQENFSLIYELCKFCWSSIYYAVQLQTKSTMPFEENVTRSLPTNSIFLLKYIKQLEQHLCSLRMRPSFYAKMFVAENNRYFAEMLKNSTYGILLYGSTTPQWNTFLELMKTFTAKNSAS